MSVKFSFQDEVRRVQLAHFDLSNWSIFCEQVRALFSAPLPGIEGNDSGWRLKYVDEEGDLITVLSACELEEALAGAGGLMRFQILPKKLQVEKKRNCGRKWESRLVRLGDKDGKFPKGDGLFNLTVCHGKVLLVQKGESSSTLRLLPNGTADLNGRFGPFARFKISFHGEMVSLFNERTNSYVKIDGEAISASPNECLVQLSCEENIQEFIDSARQKMEKCRKRCKNGNATTSEESTDSSSPTDSENTGSSSNSDDAQSKEVPVGEQQSKCAIRREARQAKMAERMAKKQERVAEKTAKKEQRMAAKDEKKKEKCGRKMAPVDTPESTVDVSVDESGLTAGQMVMLGSELDKYPDIFQVSSGRFGLIFESQSSGTSLRVHGKTADRNGRRGPWAQFKSSKNAAGEITLYNAANKSYLSVANKELVTGPEPRPVGIITL